MNDVRGNYELPTGWEWTTLESIVVDVEKVNPKIDSPSHEFVYLDISSIDNKNQKIANYKSYIGEDAPSRARQLIKSDDILFSTVRTYLKNIAMVDKRYDNQIASTGFCVIRPHEPIEKKLIFYLVQTDDFLKPLNRIQRGVSYPTVRDSDVFAQLIPLPPLPEQRRIVAKIEELFTQLDAGVLALEKAQAQLKRYRKSVLKAAVEGKLTREWREAHPGVGPAMFSFLQEQIERELKKSGDVQRRKLPPPKVSELPELPGGWVWATVGQLGDVRLGRQRSPRNHTGDYMRPYLRVANVFENRIDISDILWMNFTPEEYETYQLRYGDVLLNEGQSLELVGRPAIYRDEVPGSCFQNTLVRFRPFRWLISEYALCVFRAYFHSGRFQKIAKWTTTMAHLGAKRFSEIEFPLPPLSEQKEIVSRVDRSLSITDQTEATIEANLKRAFGLRKSILKKAFRGELGPQDPNDEPASELIRRIREERDKNKQKEKPIKQEKNVDVFMSGPRRSLYYILVEAKVMLTPEELFSKAGFTLETIDEFYQELRSEIDPSNPRVEQIRPNSKDVYLKVRGNENTQS